MALPDDPADLAQRDPVASLLEPALGLDRPWQIEKLEFDPDGRRLDLHLGFPRGSRFARPECGSEGCGVHDTVSKEWRHLNFFQQRPTCTRRCRGFALLFEPWR